MKSLYKRSWWLQVFILAVSSSTETAGQPADRPRLHQFSTAHLWNAGALGGCCYLLWEAGPTWQGTQTNTHTTKQTHTAGGFHILKHTSSVRTLSLYHSYFNVRAQVQRLCCFMSSWQCLNMDQTQDYVLKTWDQTWVNALTILHNFLITLCSFLPWRQEACSHLCMLTTWLIRVEGHITTSLTWDVLWEQLSKQSKLMYADLQTRK